MRLVGFVQICCCTRSSKVCSMLLRVHETGCSCRNLLLHTQHMNTPAGGLVSEDESAACSPMRCISSGFKGRSVWLHVPLDSVKYIKHQLMGTKTLNNTFYVVVGPRERQCHNAEACCHVQVCLWQLASSPYMSSRGVSSLVFTRRAIKH